MRGRFFSPVISQEMYYLKRKIDGKKKLCNYYLKQPVCKMITTYDIFSKTSPLEYGKEEIEIHRR